MILGLLQDALHIFRLCSMFLSSTGLPPFHAYCLLNDSEECYLINELQGKQWNIHSRNLTLLLMF